MDDEAEAAPPPKKPSQVPSWVTLGFVLGALFVLALPRRGEEPVARPPADAPVQAPPKPPAAPRMTTIEAVFSAWEKYAVWSNDTTEVALWSPEAMSYSECYEVLRTPAGYFFRSIPRLTRPVLTHGVVNESPLQFTETVRQRQEWLGEVDRENLKALSEAARQALPAPEEPRK